MEAIKCDRCGKLEAHVGYLLEVIKLSIGQTFGTFGTWSPRTCEACYTEFQKLFKPMQKELLKWYEAE